MKSVTMHEREICSCNILRVAVGTTGFCGGDSGHGGKTVLELEDLSSTDIRVTLLDDKLGNGGVRIELGGDTELETFVEALEWAAKKLREQEPSLAESFVEPEDWIEEPSED